MSIIRSDYTNIKGERVEQRRDTYKTDQRHFVREAKSQKAQLESHSHGTRKDLKVKMHRKLK